MTDPYYNQQNGDQPQYPPYGAGQQQPYQQPYQQGQYQQSQYQQGQYPPPGYGAPQPGFQYGQVYGADAMAPYGRDPRTGEPLSDKSKIAAGLLQIFLGQFGAGRFYIGDNKTAVIQLVLTLIGYVLAVVIVGIFLVMAVGIWALIDGIMMLTGSVRDAQGRPLRS